MEETTIFQEGSSLVTSSRIEIDGQTFAVRNVGSVKVDKPGRPWFAGFLFVVGLAMLPGKAWVGGVMLVGATGFWIWQQVRMRTLVLVSGGGETVALKSTNGLLVESLRRSIAQAISTR